MAGRMTSFDVSALKRRVFLSQVHDPCATVRSRRQRDRCCLDAKRPVVQTAVVPSQAFPTSFINLRHVRQNRRSAFQAMKKKANARLRIVASGRSRRREPSPPAFEAARVSPTGVARGEQPPHARQSSAEAHRLLKLAISSARMVAWTWDRHRNTITTSGNCARIYGVSGIQDAEQGKAMVHPEDRERHFAIVAVATHRRRSYHSVFRIIRPDNGKIVWLDEHAAPVLDRAGRLVAFSGIIIDITKQKAAEEQQRESELLFRQVTDAIEQVFWMTDVTMRKIHYISPPYERIWGRTCQSLRDRPQSWLDAIHPADRVRVRAAMRQQQVVGNYDIEFRIVRPDGGERWIRDRAFPIRDAEGKVQRIAGIAEDITSRKRSEVERERLVRLIESSGDFIATASLDGRITYMNSAGRGMIGLGPDEDPGTLHFADYIPPNWLSFFRKTVVPTARRTGIWEGEMQLRNLKTAALIDVFRSVFLVRDPHTGVPICFATVTRDITEQKGLERQLTETGERERRQLGHELHDGLGQQLHAIHYLCALLHRNLQDETSPRTADAARLTKLLREAVAITRDLAHGLQPVSAVPEGLMSALRQLAARTRALYGIDCRLHCRRQVLVASPTAAAHLYRIAQEAVNNAIKHARPTHIRIELSAGNGRITIGVCDDGIGIHRRRREGMGLHVMQHRANAINATLVILRQPGRGTEVVCSVPQAATVDPETIQLVR